MKERTKKLTSLDDLFRTDEERAADSAERVTTIQMDKLRYFKEHPFQVRDDEEMQSLVESVEQFGVLSPILVRTVENGMYEIVSGHRRHRASELANVTEIPAIVRDLSDDEAIILMVDANLQREKLLPSEKALAYKMKLDAMKRQGKRTDLTCAQVGHKSDGKKSRDILAEQVGQSKNQIQRFIRLTELIPPLLDMVDEKKIAFNPAYELSFLTKEEQKTLVETMDYEQATPSLSQAQRMKKFSQEGKLTGDVMLAIMSEEKKSDLDKVTFTSDTLRKYFPKSYTPKKMEETIIKLLEQWQKKRQHQQER